MDAPVLSHPPLPRTWPFEPRPGVPFVAVPTGLAVPGLPGRWSGILSQPLAEQPWTAVAAEGLGGAFGRGGVFRLGDVVLRPYRRGGMVRHLVSDRYLGRGRFLKELAVHRALFEAGFPTVEPLGVLWQRAGLGCRGVMLTRRAEATAWPRQFGEALPPGLQVAFRALVDWGLWCPDLNATNVMLIPNGVLLLDWDRAGWTADPRLGLRYRQRLLRSLSKLLAPPSLLDALTDFP